MVGAAKDDHVPAWHAGLPATDEGASQKHRRSEQAWEHRCCAPSLLANEPPEKEKPMLHRRMMMAALAAAASSPAFAQNRSGSNAGSANAGSPEMQYIRQTMGIGSLSLAVSRIAEQKASFDKLKEFSRLETAEQETVADVLKSLESAGPVSGMVKPPSEAEVEQHLDQAGREALQKMRAQQAGAAFDHDYLTAQIDGHQKLLRIQEDYLRSGRDLDAVNVAKLARGMIKEHLELLADISKEMSSVTTGAAPRDR
jgi:putative membrane protein